MKIKIAHIGVLVISLALTSCGGENQTQENQDNQETSADQQLVNSESKEEMPKLDVKLNNGEKWEANPETTQGIEAMIKVVEKSSPGKNRELNYQSTATELASIFQEIFAKCTMKGEAHDQLHNYLIPLKGHIAQLGNNDKAASKVAMDKISNHLKAYYLYFK